MSIDIWIIAGYLIGTVALGLYLSRYVKTDSDYFLAGRSLNKWVVAGTIIATDVAAIYIVGPAGNAYEGGAPVLLCAWVGNMIAAVSALFVVPRLRRLRITTISEILEERYSIWIRLFPTVLWIFYYALFAGNAMWAFSVIISPILEIRASTVIFCVGGGVILYCFFSGLLAVVYTDVIQTFLIIIGGMILLPLSLKAVGGVQELARTTPPEFFVFWRADDVWPNYRTLIMFILISFPYWCTSQYMLQRSMAGRSVRDASRGLMLAAVFTGSITFAFILPGICGFHLYPDGALEQADSVLIRLFLDVLPVGLGGIFIAALLAANTSTTSSLLNSLSTLTVNDIYRRFNPGKTPLHYISVGRLATAFGGAIGMWFAFNVDAMGGIVKANFEIMALFEPQIFVVVAAALFWKNAHSWGAALVIIVGTAFNLVAFSQGVSMEDRTFVAFPLCIVALFLGTWLGHARSEMSRETRERIDRLYARMQGEPVQWRYLPGWCGLAVSLVSLTLMTLSMIFVDLIPRPYNVVAVMVFVATWVLGLYVAVPMFVSDEPELAGKGEAASVEGSWIHRIVGSGWTWLSVYVLATSVMIILYFS